MQALVHHEQYLKHNLETDRVTRQNYSTFCQLLIVNRELHKTT